MKQNDSIHHPNLNSPTLQNFAAPSAWFVIPIYYWFNFFSSVCACLPKDCWWCHFFQGCNLLHSASWLQLPVVVFVFVRMLFEGSIEGTSCWWLFVLLSWPGVDEEMAKIHQSCSVPMTQNDAAAFISQGQFNDGTNCPAHLTPSLRSRIRCIRHVFIVFRLVYCSYVYFCMWPDILREAFLCLHGDEQLWCPHPLKTNRCSSSSETLRCEIKQEEEMRWSITKLQDRGVVVSARNGERKHQIFTEMEVCLKMRELWSRGKDKEEGSTEEKQTEWKKKM